MMSLYRNATRIHPGCRRFCVKSVLALTPRRDITSESGNDKNESAEDTANSWSRFKVAEKIQKVTSALRTLIGSTSSLTDAPDSAKSEKVNLDVLTAAQLCTKPRDAAGLDARIGDLLSHAVASGWSADEFSEFIEEYGQVMNKDHILLLLGNCTKSVFMRRKEFRANPAFQTLTEILLKRMNSFAARDLTYIFRSVEVLEKRKPGEDSILLNGVLAALRLKLKDLTLIELIHFLRHLIKADHAGTYTEMTRDVIPVIIETRYRKELDMTDIQNCFALLIISSFSRSSVEVCTDIADAAVQVSPYFSTWQAFDVFNCLSRNRDACRQSSSVRRILAHCMVVISNNLNGLDEQRITNVLLTSIDGDVGTKTFFDALWGSAPVWSVRQVELLLRASFGRSYMTLHAAELVTRMIRVNKLHSFQPEKNRNLTTGDPLYIMPFLISVVLWQNQQKPGSVGMSHCVQAANILIEWERSSMRLSTRHVNFFDFLIRLVYVGVFPESFFEKAFDPDYQNNCPPQAYEKLFRLERHLLLHYGKDSPYRVLPELKTFSQQTFSDRIFSFERALEAALGGTEFFGWNVRTPLGTEVDYVVAMLSEDKAIPFLNRENFFEVLPPGAKVVAFVLCKSNQHVHRMTGLRKTNLLINEREMQAQNLSTVVIDLEEFQSLQSRDANAWLSTALREAYSSGPEYVHRSPC